MHGDLRVQRLQRDVRWPVVEQEAMWIEHVPGERRRIRVAGSEQRVFLQRRTAAARSIKNGGIVSERRDVFAYEFASAGLQAGAVIDRKRTRTNSSHKCP